MVLASEFMHLLFSPGMDLKGWPALVWFHVIKKYFYDQSTYLIIFGKNFRLVIDYCYMGKSSEESVSLFFSEKPNP